MKPIRKRLEEARRDIGLSWEIIEKDYILSWVLAGIAANKKLQNELIFKGGTALKKCYFGNYRFSEDLDFTAKEEIVRGDFLEKEIKKSCEIATNLVQKFSPLELKVEYQDPFGNSYEEFYNVSVRIYSPSEIPQSRVSPVYMFGLFVVIVIFVYLVYKKLKK